MIKAFTLLLALLIGLSFSGMTFAKSLGTSSSPISVQDILPQGDGSTDDTKDGDKGDAPNMGDDKGDGEGEDEDKK